MAEKLTGGEWPAKPKGKYPWDEWLDGNVWELTPGVDFTVPATSFRSAVSNIANRRHGTARTCTDNGQFFLQFIKEGS